MPQSWGIDRPRQCVAKDVKVVIAWHITACHAQELEHLVVAARAQSPRVKWHGTDRLGPLPCGCGQEWRHVGCQRSRQMAVSTVLEAQECLGQRAPIGKRCECPNEGKRRSPTSSAQTAAL